jgi:hypothetical protein
MVNIMEFWWNKEWLKKNKALGEESTTNPIWSSPSWKTDPNGEKPASNSQLS